MALGLAAAGAIVAAVLLVGPSSTTSSIQYRDVTVERGVVQESESASGNLAPVSESDLNFKSSGILTHLYVSTGEHVKAGTLLATIDPTDAQVALEEAQANLEAARAKLAETEADPSGSSSTSASPSGSAAAAAVKPASDAFAGTGASDATGATGASSTTGLTSPATTTAPSGSTGGGSSTGAGRTNTTTSSGTTGSTTATSSAVTTATDQANLASARAAVSSDELTVKTDEAALAGTKLYAPTAGTIASISGAVGDEVTAGSGGATSSAGTGSGSSTAALSSTSTSTSTSSASSSGSGFIVLADLSSMQMVVSVSEADIGTIKVGEPATVSVDALPDAEFAAKVTAISVLSSDTSGVVSYDVTLALTQSSNELRDGMSATATIIDKQVSDAINVDSAAISSRGNESTVMLVKNGKMVVTPVITGLVGSSTTQIVAGLSAGEEVAIEQATSIATATGTSSSSSTGTLGGAGGFGGGGFAGGGFGGGGFAGRRGG